MAVDLKFLASLIDNSDSSELSEHRILGVRLRKFCLWHRLLLRAAESPFVLTKPVSLFDLRTAVGICRLRFGQSKVKRPRIAPALLLAGAALRGLFTRRANDPEAGNPLQQALHGATSDFLSYCGDYLQDPDYAIIPSDIGRSKPRTPRGRPPQELEHAADLIHFGFSEQRAWEMPLGLANFYRVMAFKQSGADVDFITPEEKAFQANLPEEYRIRKGATRGA